MAAIFKREFRAYFTSPLGYAVLAIFFLFTGLYFDVIFSGGYSFISVIFANMSVLILFVTPLLTMRLLSEERRQKTDQAFFTAPIKLRSVVLGKFWAAMALFGLGFSVTFIFQIVLSCYASVNWLLYLNCLVGTALLGAGMIAIGIFLSSLTESPVLAAIFGIVVSFLLLQMDSFAGRISTPWLRTLVAQFAIVDRFVIFTNGIFDLRDAVFFLSITALFLFLSTRMLERKRWA